MRAEIKPANLNRLVPAEEELDSFPLAAAYWDRERLRSTCRMLVKELSIHVSTATCRIHSAKHGPVAQSLHAWP